MLCIAMNDVKRPLSEGSRHSTVIRHCFWTARVIPLRKIKGIKKWNKMSPQKQILPYPFAQTRGWSVSAKPQKRSISCHSP